MIFAVRHLGKGHAVGHGAVGEDAYTRLRPL